MNQRIDAVDYAVLKCLDENGGCWKKRVHDWINDHHEELPRLEKKSVQTIGRRIDQLHEAGLIESCILAPDSVDRDMIIGYKLTNEGKGYLDAERTEFLKEKVLLASEAFLERHEDHDEFSISRPALIELMADEFNIPPHERDLLENCHTDELITVLMHHFFRTEASPSFDEHAEDRITALITRTPQLVEPYQQETLSDRVRKRLSETRQAVKGMVWKRVQA